MSSNEDAFSANRKIYEAMVATQPGIERKGQKVPYTSMNGNMFSFLAGDGTICFRLSGDDEQAFVKRFKTSPVEQHGRVMKEYVAVPDALLAKPKELSDWFSKSVAHARSLKPKPTKRKSR